MKELLSHQALKIRDKILENVYTYCKETVYMIDEAYDTISKTVLADPGNERELVATRDFIKETPHKVELLQ